MKLQKSGMGIEKRRQLDIWAFGKDSIKYPEHANAEYGEMKAVQKQQHGLSERKVR